MLQWIFVALFALLALEAETTNIKWHSVGAAFDNANAWLDDYLPCAQDLVVFPSYYPAVLPLPKQLAVGGFVLPRLGGLLLAEDATIELGLGTGLNSACGSSERRAYLKPAKTSKWFDPSSWRGQPSSSSSSASTSSSAIDSYFDLDRVPCDDEHVVISGNSGALSFDLENVQFLRLGQLILAGSSISRNYLQELLSRDLGQLLFHNAQNVFVEYYRGELCGCHKDYEHLLELVCSHVEPQCEVPHCVSPLRTNDGCCLVCGAMLHVNSEHCVEEDRKSLITLIDSFMAKEQLQDELQLHVNYVGSSAFGNALQAIVVDRRGYSERSVEFMKRFAAQRNQSKFLAQQKNLKLFYSGHPYNPNVSFASVLLILFCVVLVGVVSLIMLAHFMPQNPYLNRIPQWIHNPRRWRWHHLDLRLPQNLLFNRFDNAAAGMGVGGAAGSAVERLAVIGYDAESEEVRERAFNNPMFEQAEQVAAIEEQPETTAMSAKVETGQLDSCSVEEQELTEINLESSDGESEDEAETKE
ncbi:protein amnionless [Drosophila hydei]|uniref:Protein amnionless n=1 Tax=Drosophila hydei TaxID=7224 RepID=A0A6J1M9V8_DROHY|nr:protein amnionless [Drosophila hydei]